MKVGTSPNEIVMFPNVLVFLRQRGADRRHQGHDGEPPRVRGDQRPTGEVDKARAARAIGSSRVRRPAPNDVVTDDISFNKEQQKLFRLRDGSGRDQGAVVRGEDERDARRAPPRSLCGSGGGDESVAREGLRREAGHAWQSMRPRTSRASTCRSRQATAPVVGTRGRVVDHIGFEVKDLEAFCRKLEGMGIKLDRPYTKVPSA